MAEEDNDEGPLSEISWRELYSFRTRQTARQTIDKPAKHRRLSASRGAYDASDEVIKYMARPKLVPRPESSSESQGQLQCETSGLESEEHTVRS